MSNQVKVVVVDDHDDLRLLLQMLIEADPRYDLVGQAADGASALVVIEAAMPDLVLLDLAMPDVDGIEVLDRCQAQWPRLPIVAVLSGFSRAVMGPVAMDHGAVAYIEKGVTLGKSLVDDLWDIWLTSGQDRVTA